MKVKASLPEVKIRMKVSHQNGFFHWPVLQNTAGFRHQIGFETKKRNLTLVYFAWSTRRAASKNME